MALIENLITKMNAISDISETSELKGYIESSEVKMQMPDNIKPAEKAMTEYDPYEFLIGSVVELEHTEDILTAMSIAMNHLDEDETYYSKLLDTVEPDFDAKKTFRISNSGGSNINVGRMIKNMSKAHVPKFDTKRNMHDRLKNLFKMPTAKDDMNAANSNRESFPIKEKPVAGEVKEKPAAGAQPVAEPEPEIIETKGLENSTFSLVATCVDEHEAGLILKNLLIKKRNAKMGQNKDGRFEITVEESFVKTTPENGLGHVEGGKEFVPGKPLAEDNTMANSGAVIGNVMAPVYTVKGKKDKE